MTEGKATKYFQLNQTVKENFERLCRFLGLHEGEVASQLLARWVEEHSSQARIDLYIPQEASIIINQPRSVNIAIRAEVTYCKLELERILPILEKLDRAENPGIYVNWLEQLTKVIIKASRIQGLAKDDELEKLLAKAEAHLK